MPAETELLRALFAAATGGDGPTGPRDLWPDFLTLLRSELRASAAALHVEAEGGARHVWRNGAMDLPGRTQMLQMRFDRVYSQIDLPGLEDRGAPIRAFKVATGPAGFAILMLGRDGQDFRAADGVQLSGLAPFLGQALLTWRDLGAERMRAALDRRVAADLGGGWIMLTASGAVTAMAAQSRSVLEGLGQVSLRPSGWLEFRDPGMGQQFRQAVAAGAGVVTLSREPLIELEITTQTLSPEPSLIGLLRHLPAARALSVERVASHFDLSRSEARLAILLCDGFTLQEAAQELGWTAETARSASKQVFARMGVRSQSAVLRRVFSSAVWMTQPA